MVRLHISWLGTRTASGRMTPIPERVRWEAVRPSPASPRRKVGMPPSSPRGLIAAVFAAAVAGAGCSHATKGAAPSSPHPVPATQADQASISKARADSARYPYTAADVRFMSGMISHHSQAIAMANWAPTHGASSAIQTLAGRIINAQQDEIATMQRWLQVRLQPVPDASPNGMKMVMNGVEHVMLMPGMLTPEQ